MANIVVVEDERELARLIGQTLRDNGHQVETIHDGQVALDRLTGPARITPDLIVLDLMLPTRRWPDDLPPRSARSGSSRS